MQSFYPVYILLPRGIYIPFTQFTLNLSASKGNKKFNTLTRNAFAAFSPQGCRFIEAQYFVFQYERREYVIGLHIFIIISLY